MAALIRNDGKMLVLLLYVLLLFVHKHCIMQQMSFCDIKIKAMADACLTRNTLH